MEFDWRKRRVENATQFGDAISYLERKIIAENCSLIDGRFKLVMRRKKFSPIISAVVVGSYAQAYRGQEQVVHTSSDVDFFVFSQEQDEDLAEEFRDDLNIESPLRYDLVTWPYLLSSNNIHKEAEENAKEWGDGSFWLIQR